MSEAVVRAWVAPEITGRVVERRSRHTRAELDEIGQQAWDEGYARGLEAAQATAARELAPRLAALGQRADDLVAALDFLAAPLAELDEAVGAQLATLACAVARQVVRRELRADPAQVIAAVRETVALLPVAARDVRVHLHPDDAALVRERLAAPQAQRAWTLVEDPVLARGGCRVVTDDSDVDARLETRLGAVIAQVLGDERADGADRAP